MRSWLLIGTAGVCGILCAGFAGCDSGGEKFTPVAGKVTVGGAPLTSGAVTFQPDADKGNNTKHIPVGNLDAQGNYTVTSAATPGAPPGWYKVTVTAQEPIDPKNPYAQPKYLINRKYGEAATSGLAVEVVAKPAAGAYDFQVTK